MTLSHQDFIERSIRVHGNRYDYSRSVYLRKHLKVRVLCPAHGEFWQRPDNHWAGHGCQSCVHEVWSKNRTKSLEKFLVDALQAHGSTYDYGGVVYRRSHIKIEIRCALHGVFRQTPNDHLAGNGCPRCSTTWQLTTDEFVRRAEVQHRKKYGYEKTNYLNMRTKVIISCRRGHKDFEVTPANHLSGNGCPVCRYSKGEAAIAQWLGGHGIEFVPQQRFPTCRYKRVLSFDFYVPNRELLIEFDGDQHRRSWFGCTKDVLGVVQHRDNIKDFWCKKNGKHLLRITRIDAVIPSLEAAFHVGRLTKVGQRVLRQLGLESGKKDQSP